MTIAELQAEILEKLTIELKNEPDFSAEILEVKIDDVIREVKLKRHYENTNYNDEQIADDLYMHYSLIKRESMIRYNQIGVEGETSHSENGVSRHYANNSLLDEVIPFVKVL